MFNAYARRIVIPMAILMLCPILTSAGIGADLQSPPPLRIGVGGDYPDGLDGVLMIRGLPHERVFPWELADAAVLNRYQVLLLSCPVATRGQLDPPLMEWIKAGGRAYIEVWAGMQGRYPFPELIAPMGNVGLEADTLLTNADDPILSGLDARLPINTFHLQGTLLRVQDPAGATVLAKFCPDGGGTPYPYGEAVVHFRLGKGELVYSGSPLSFCCFHRGPTTEPLLMNVINHLSDARAVARLTTGAAEAEEAGPPPAGGMPTASSTGLSAAPSGYEVIEEETEAPYNIVAQVVASPKSRDRETILMLDAQAGADGKLKRPALWVVLGPNQIALHAGASAKSPILASAAWELPTQPQALMVRRRPGTVAVVLGDQQLLAAKTDVKPAGGIAVSAGCAELMQAHCQPVEPPDFADDFMRDPGDPSPWTTISGQWRTVGLGSEKQSVNGFYFRGSDTATALAGAGEDWWEDYTASVAARLDDESTCGLVMLRQGNGDYLGFTADSAKQASAALKLVQVRAGKETVLAQRPGGIAPAQWFRLTIRCHAGKLEALLDDEPVLQAALTEPRGGGIGLLVRRGGARFDDVLVQPASQPLASPRHEGSATVEMPPSPGPQDTLTWANRAAAWTASPERPSLLWHVGSFSHDLTFSVPVEAQPTASLRRLILAPTTASPASEWLSVTATVEPQPRQALLALVVPGKEPVEKKVALTGPGRLALVREAEGVQVLWNKETVLRAAADAGPRAVGLEVQGAPVPAEGIQVISPQTRDYVFSVAPVDWHVAAGTWQIASRWACDSRWSWFAGWGDGDFSVWNKHRVDGDVTLDFYMGIKMEAPGGSETIRARDLNATLCGDMANPRSGYSFITGGDGGTKTQLLRNGVVVAEAPDLRVPSGYGVHHEWFHLRLARVGHRLEMDFEGRPVFCYDDPDPLPGGFVGLWSRDSGILVPRVTIYQ